MISMYIGEIHIYIEKLMGLIELSEDQRRQYIDAERVFQALEAAEVDARKYVGSMIWREQSGHKYLIRTLPDASQKSVGRETPELQAAYVKFMTEKAKQEDRVKSLREQAEKMRRLNRALRIGRTPDIIIDVINAMKKTHVSEHFLLVGTNALYAYETAAGVRFPHDVMATRKRGEFLDLMGKRGLSFLDLLRKVDKTFDRHPDERHTAVNNKGYEIDVIRRFPPPELEATEHPMRMTDDEDDLWAARASTGQQLLSVPKFKQVVVGTSGAMATMTTVHPLDFSRIKHALSKMRERDPLKAAKDELQAVMVEELVAQYLPNLSRHHEYASEAPEQDDGAAHQVQRG